MRWPKSDYSDIEEHRIYQPGAPDKHKHGVLIIIPKSIAQNALLPPRISPTNTNIHTKNSLE